jgi:hypothetical protein
MEQTYVTVETGTSPAPCPERRRTCRRSTTYLVDVERRSSDRRRRKPGVAALLGAVLAETLHASWLDAEVADQV